MRESPIKYAVYPPTAEGLPWLALVLRGDRPVETFGSAHRQGAERVLIELEARSRGRGLSPGARTFL